jgi:hypothetical protein
MVITRQKKIKMPVNLLIPYLLLVLQTILALGYFAKKYFRSSEKNNQKKYIKKSAKWYFRFLVAFKGESG